MCSLHMGCFLGLGIEAFLFRTPAFELCKLCKLCHHVSLYTGSFLHRGIEASLHPLTLGSHPIWPPNHKWRGSCCCCPWPGTSMMVKSHLSVTNSFAVQALITPRFVFPPSSDPLQRDTSVPFVSFLTPGLRCELPSPHTVRAFAPR